MFLNKIRTTPIILGSQSPRRSELLKSMDLDFDVQIKSIDESIPNSIKTEKAAEYIALKKVEAFKTKEFHNKLIITADTIVVDHEKNILGKPVDKDEATNVIKKLSGNIHSVHTGVALLYNEQIWSFSSVTEVIFNKLQLEEINYYIDKYKPYDKAGSYGIQEWIGKIGINRINGSYENVMGLPTSRLYEELIKIEKGL